MNAKDRIILALDVDSADKAVDLVRLLHGHVGSFKVGLELVNAAGVEIFSQLQEAGAERIFYDAKLHDIPNTVAGAVRAVAGRRLWMINVHASGGSRMIRAAEESLRTSSAWAGVLPPLLIAVTLLTSLGDDDLADELSVGLPPSEYVTSLARLAQSSGADGVVASPHEIEAIRAACGPAFLIVTPGVRPAGSEAGDQRRVMTPGEAVRLGADYLVIGRPITAAPDPVAAAAAIVHEIAHIEPD